jgi:hypothetical protein
VRPHYFADAPAGAPPPIRLVWRNHSLLPAGHRGELSGGPVLDPDSDLHAQLEAAEVFEVCALAGAIRTPSREHEVGPFDLAVAIPDSGCKRIRYRKVNDWRRGCATTSKVFMCDSCNSRVFVPQSNDSVVSLVISNGMDREDPPLTHHR